MATVKVASCHTTNEAGTYHQTKHDVFHLPRSRKEANSLALPILTVETGHFPSWPLIEIRKTFIKPYILYRTGLPIGQHHGFADQFSLGLFKRTENG